MNAVKKIYDENDVMRRVWRTEAEDVKTRLNKNIVLFEYGRVKLRHNSFQNIYIVDVDDYQHQNIVFNHQQYASAVECFNKKIYDVYNMSYLNDDD